MGWKMQVLGMKGLGIRNEGFGYQGWRMRVPGMGWRMRVPRVEDLDTRDGGCGFQGQDGGFGYQGWRMRIPLSGSTFGPGLLRDFYFQRAISGRDLIIIFPAHNTALSWSAGE